MATLVCSKCDASAPVDSLFCPRCNAPLSSGLFDQAPSAAPPPTPEPERRVVIDKTGAPARGQPPAHSAPLELVAPPRSNPGVSVAERTEAADTNIHRPDLGVPAKPPRARSDLATWALIAGVVAVLIAAVAWGDRFFPKVDLHVEPLHPERIVPEDETVKALREMGLDDGTPPVAPGGSATFNAEGDVVVKPKQ